VKPPEIPLQSVSKVKSLTLFIPGALILTFSPREKRSPLLGRKRPG
jgi:hypothetical protein